MILLVQRIMRFKIIKNKLLGLLLKSLKKYIKKLIKIHKVNESRT